MKSTEWVAPNAEVKYRVACDPCIATGIYREDGSIVTHVEVGSENEIRASRSLATGVRDKSLQHEGIAAKCRVGIQAHSLNVALKIINTVKGFGKLLLQRFKCGRGHKGSEIILENVKGHAPAPAQRTPMHEKGGDK
jgi:hypothetical protein